MIDYILPITIYQASIIQQILFLIRRRNKKRKCRNRRMPWLMTRTRGSLIMNLKGTKRSRNASVDGWMRERIQISRICMKLGSRMNFKCKKSEKSKLVINIKYANFKLNKEKCILRVSFQQILLSNSKNFAKFDRQVPYAATNVWVIILSLFNIFPM